ncbi:MAG: class I SAM-dependent rRNA methyltransferase, partial [Nitrospinaceae bacterium]|nr:class I SAM-dependent rRNA methyltransferase [Nitrospinaceae bacterium]NIR54311.1 class I SAM-dependent rRNA methyltransferase [Nitrospinaceae bacterium]NIS84729.1 class I SAM-dependent rRNA methyltransferase [Nitrospinaceae bacterium]NIT81530.1 class I SAM-dependent rRNA methyltransferase [Nitrospinaceae bacterium]NIU43815.1 class I SAM-dependent rRNA methyltransferase [Nitrospinaceae bacterium]
QIQNDVPRGEPGDLGVLYDHRNKFLAIGLWDPFSDLRLRILQTREPVEIGPEFFCRQLCRALESRKHLQAEGTTGYRVVHGENDGFPGLVLDRYDDTGVVKLYTAAWVPYLEPLLALFRDRVPLRRCVLRLGRNARGPIEATGKFRDGQGVFGPKVEGPVRFRENGLRFEAAVLSGPKTGFFLDQRENRRRFQALARDRSVLNGFSYSGAFSVYAFAGGGRSVMEIDTNLHALETSRKMVSLNFPGRSFGEAALAQRQGDAFEELKILREKGQAFDLVLLDPPAFASSRKQKARALSAYRRLAEAGARVTRSGG